MSHPLYGLVLLTLMNTHKWDMPEDFRVQSTALLMRCPVPLCIMNPSTFCRWNRQIHSYSDNFMNNSSYCLFSLASFSVPASTVAIQSTKQSTQQVLQCFALNLTFISLSVNTVPLPQHMPFRDLGYTAFSFSSYES